MRYLKVWCKAARVGTQLARGDGTQVREYRPEDEVSNPDSLFIWNEGSLPQSSEGVAGFQDHETTSGWARVRMFVSPMGLSRWPLLSLTKTQSMQSSVEMRRKSARVIAWTDPTPGVTPDGESYDGIQRNIKVITSLVARARAGREANLLLDSCDRNDAVADIEPRRIRPYH